MHRYLIMFMAVLMAGCQTQMPAPVEKIGVPGSREPISEESLQDEARAVSDLLLYAQRVGHMSAEEQRREAPQLANAMSRDRSLASRLRLALLLSQPGSAVQDEGRALSLLEAYANPAPNAGPLRQFAALLQFQLAERVRATRRAEQLKEQLEALRAIERSIIERGKMPQPRKP